MEKIEWKIPKISNDPDDSILLSVNEGDQLFIVGPNGSGKSALIQYLVSNVEIDKDKIRRITAHRQTSLKSGTINFTPAQRTQFSRNYLGYNQQNSSRYLDNYASEEQSAILYDLDNRYNIINETIANHHRNQNIEKASETALKSPSPFDQLNELLDHGRLNVNLERTIDRSIIANHLHGQSFDISKMSDGERSAVIIAGHVVTAEPGTVFLIDEPEKHLHRSISQPLLSALFDLRKDCAFIISTHEIELAIANSEARVLMLRSCQWSGEECVGWEVEVIEPNFQLPEKLWLTEETKRAIIGSRKRILFVEGDSNSLDIQLYEVLFPDLTVIPKGNCENVINAVLGLRKSQEVHDVEAFGLIDGDNRDNKEDRDNKEVDKLADSCIYVLEVYSVEALYYCSEVITAVAHQHVEFLGEGDPNELVRLVHQNVIEVLNNPKKDHQIAERMAARRCERQVHNLFWSNVPNWKSIMDNSTQPICVSINPHPYPKELEHFNTLVDNGEIDSLIARYPLRDSQVFETIVQTLGCESQKFYERMVVKLVKDDEKVAKCIKKRIGQLSDALNKTDKPEII